MSEVWTEGPDVVLIDQGASQGAEAVRDDPDAIEVNSRDVKVGKYEEGRAALFDGVRAKCGSSPAAARFVRVRGT